MHSFNLWLRFFFYGLISLAKIRWPLTIRNSEILARELFSGHVKKNGVTLKVNAFKINRKSENGISLDRISLAPLKCFASLALASAKRRGVKFKGFAKIEPSAIARIHFENDDPLSAIGNPSKINPFHANVSLPPDREDDYYLFIATEFLRYSNFDTRSSEYNQ